jgi:uncharacterized protein
MLLKLTTSLKKTKKMKLTKERRNYLITALVVFFTALITYFLISAFCTLQNFSQKEGDSVVEVTGVGEVFARPDLAVVSFSVENEEKEAEQVLLKNAEKVNSVIDYFKDKGIEEKDIKTTAFNLYPRYEYYGETSYLKPEEGRLLVGYEAIQTVEVKIREIDKIGEFLEGGVVSGANRVHGISFTVENEKELIRKAREIAIKEAKNEAEILSNQLGVRLTGIIGFNEQKDGGINYMRSLGMGEMDKMIEFAAPEIATGENKITSRVYLRYKIK